MRNLEEFRRPNVGIRSSRVATSFPGIHDLFRGTNPHPITGAPIVYTDGRTLPLETAAVGSAPANETGRQQHNDCGNAQAAGQDREPTVGRESGRRRSGSGFSSLPPPMTQEFALSLLTVHLPVTQAPVRAIRHFPKVEVAGMQISTLLG